MPRRVLLPSETADCDDCIEPRSSVSAKHRPNQQHTQHTETSPTVTPSDLQNYSLFENSKIPVGQAMRR